MRTCGNVELVPPLHSALVSHADKGSMLQGKLGCLARVRSQGRTMDQPSSQKPLDEVKCFLPCSLWGLSAGRQVVLSRSEASSVRLTRTEPCRRMGRERDPGNSALNHSCSTRKMRGEAEQQCPRTPHLQAPSLHWGGGCPPDCPAVSHMQCSPALLQP